MKPSWLDVTEGKEERWAGIAEGTGGRARYRRKVPPLVSGGGPRVLLRRGSELDLLRETFMIVCKAASVTGGQQQETRGYLLNY